MTETDLSVFEDRSPSLNSERGHPTSEKRTLSITNSLFKKEEPVVKLFISALIFTLTAACSGGTSTPENPPAAESAAPAAPEFDTMDYRIRVATVADNLEYPYSMAFLPP